MEGWIQPWSHPITTKFCSAVVLLKPQDIPRVIFSRWMFSHHPSASSRQFSVIPPPHTHRPCSVRHFHMQLPKSPFLPQEAPKDKLSLLTALPHIQHTVAKPEQASLALLLWGYHAKPIWSTAGRPLSEVSLTLTGGVDAKTPFWKGHVRLCIYSAQPGTCWPEISCRGGYKPYQQSPQEEPSPLWQEVGQQVLRQGARQSAGSWSNSKGLEFASLRDKEGTHSGTLMLSSGRTMKYEF